MNQYFEGTAITIDKTFLDENGTPVDPTDVSFFTRRVPTQTPTEYESGVSPLVDNPSTGRYVLALPGTLTPGYYRGWIVGTGDVEATDPFDFEVIPLDPEVQSATPPGPCMPWIDGDAVAQMCNGGVGSDTWLYDQAAYAASEILYMLSGQQYPGECERVARPCATYQSCGWAQGVWLPASSGYGWEIGWRPWLGGWGWFTGDGHQTCSCHHEEKIALSGYPVSSIVEVTIGADVVDPSTYRLEDRRYLVRVTPEADEHPRLRWPSCQRMELPLGEPGTWSVQYRAGTAPPKTGEMAAAQLACEIWKATQNDDDCQLPQAVTQVNRQGISYSVQMFGQWGRQNGLWRTGLSLVDAFLQSFNPTGQLRRSAVWSPDLDEMAPVVGG